MRSTSSTSRLSVIPSEARNLRPAAGSRSFASLRMTTSASPRAILALLHSLVLCATLLCVPGDARAQADSAARESSDPRVTLRGGWKDAAVAARYIELVGHADKPEGFFDLTKLGDLSLANSDLAFRGNLLVQGNFHGFQIWDISNPRKPVLRTKHDCRGAQGDPSIYGNLLFISGEDTQGRLDCGGQGVTDTVSAERFRGVRIFDISDLDRPKQVAAVQTCRGSHTHTLVTDPNDRANVYIYVGGTGPVRSATELAGCSGRAPAEDPNTALFRIDVIRVPLAAPQDAKVIGGPRIFADTTTGAIAGLWKGGAHGPETQTTSETDQCHDLTVYPEMGIAAGACSGNGILLDIRDVANPKRTAEVSDPNFAYWHSATFSNDGKKVVFTDEWGGGTSARCRASDRREWGANAIYTLGDGKPRFASFYKLPAPQPENENCVAHNGSLIPVPGRDIMAQGWYQGGLSVFDFTDATRPVEIAYFDRGPLAAELETAGIWGAYWYNGYLYGSEMARGIDIFELKPSAQLSANEIAAAKLVRFDQWNPQHQQKLVWPAHFAVARAYVDQLVRNRGLPRARTTAIVRELDRAERLTGARRRTALTQLATQLDSDASSASDQQRVRALASIVRDLAKG